MKKDSIFVDFLNALKIKHTENFSNQQFENMSFKSLFGLSELLDSYNVPNAGWKIPDKASFEKLKPPFISMRNENFEVVTAITADNVSFYNNGVISNIPLNDYEKEWNNIILTASPTSQSIEPSYRKHRILDIASSALNWILIASFTAVVAYLYITRHFYHNAALTVLTAVDMAGIAITAMLMLKSINVHLKVADNVCGILQEGGCDKILAMDASKFFGLFGWAEVGFGYFLVSTSVLLLFPSYIHYLALANLCCLPFTCWSIWYQKFRAKHWCTLCVITQGLLWCQFICYICGGFEKNFNLCRWEPWILLMSYITAVLALNKTAQLINNKNN